MFPTAFSYHRAVSIDDAVNAIAGNPDAKILAGGHSLIPAMKLRLAMPGALVDITRIDALREISVGDEIRIGATATYDQIRDHAEVAALLPILPQAIEVVGDQQVRARGTLGGSIAHADPAADLTAVFLALNGRVRAVGANGEREIAGDDFFLDLWTTALQPDEVLVDVIIPRPAADTKMAYVKHAHPASGYAVAGVAAVLPMADGAVAGARVVVTGATSKPTRITAVEDALEGMPVGSITPGDVARGASNGLQVNGDTYASEAYRAHLVEVMVSRAIERALA